MNEEKKEVRKGFEKKSIMHFHYIITKIPVMCTRQAMFEGRGEDKDYISSLSTVMIMGLLAHHYISALSEDEKKKCENFNKDFHKAIVDYEENVLNKETRILYGKNCTWWGTIDETDVVEGFNIPCCPVCTGPLFEVQDMEEWVEKLDLCEKHKTDYKKMILWGKGQCFQTIDDLQTAYNTELIVNAKIKESKIKNNQEGKDNDTK